MKLSNAFRAQAGLSTIFWGPKKFCCPFAAKFLFTFSISGQKMEVDTVDSDTLKLQ
jgi:hypothetical protein